MAASSGGNSPVNGFAPLIEDASTERRLFKHDNITVGVRPVRKPTVSAVSRNKAAKYEHRESLEHLYSLILKIE